VTDPTGFWQCPATQAHQQLLLLLLCAFERHCCCCCCMLFSVTAAAAAVCLLSVIAAAAPICCQASPLQARSTDTPGAPTQRRTCRIRSCSQRWGCCSATTVQQQFEVMYHRGETQQKGYQSMLLLFAVQSCTTVDADDICTASTSIGAALVTANVGSQASQHLISAGI
jgi:hypothetical protein